MSSAANFPELLRRAGEGRIEPFFQPIIRLCDETVTGFEALARWRKLDGHIAQVEMFPAHAWTDEAMHIGRAATMEAIAYFASARGDESKTLGLNMTARDLNEGGAAFLMRCIEDNALPPSIVTVELTEHHWLSDVARAAEDLAMLRAHGMRVALDDFGTGHASLAWLARLPVDIVKLDQGFTRRVDVDGAERVIARAVLEMCAELKIAVVAEGVETHAQRDWLQDKGCVYGQGQLWSMPLPARQAMTFAVAERAHREMGEGNALGVSR